MNKPWVNYVAKALDLLGGEARYDDLYAKIQELRLGYSFTREWKATVRNTVESHSTDSNNFRGKNYFYTPSLGSGVWGLTSEGRQFLMLIDDDFA